MYNSFYKYSNYLFYHLFAPFGKSKECDSPITIV